MVIMLMGFLWGMSLLLLQLLIGTCLNNRPNSPIIELLGLLFI